MYLFKIYLMFHSCDKNYEAQYREKLSIKDAEVHDLSHALIIRVSRIKNFFLEKSFLGKYAYLISFDTDKSA